MPFTVSPAPIEDSVIQTDEHTPGRANPFYLAKGWIIWLQDALLARVAQTAQTLKTLSLINQHATLGATAIPMPAIGVGLYRVDVYLRITTPAGVSSSATVTIGWTDGGISCTAVFPAVTGNTPSSTLPAPPLFLHVDQNSAITYAVAYASNPAAIMQYRLDLAVVKLA